MGQCPSCKEWNTLEEEAAPRSVGAGAGLGKSIAKGGGASRSSAPAAVKRLSDHDAAEYPRFSTGSSEFDAVLGGGVVPGSSMSLAAQPGAGKSTLCSATVDFMAGAGKRVLWVAGEESGTQIRMRTDRMGLKHSGLVDVASETEVGAICARMEAGYDFVVVDSINTIHDAEKDGAPGSTSVVKETAMAMTRTAKDTGCALLMIAHVTKDGTMGGPKHFEHIVDVVMELVGERTRQVRVLRALKNRFGSTNEVGVFEMTGHGLTAVEDPLRAFLDDRGDDVVGAAICPVVEGTRPMMVEVQALCSPTNLPTPMRRAQGIDKNKLDMLIAILQQHSGMSLKLGTKDIYVQVSGGATVKEPAVDLAVCAAIASSADKRAVPLNVAIYGEVSLLGEVRPVAADEQRTAAARKMGAKTVIAGRGQGTQSVRRLSDALDAALSRPTAESRAAVADDDREALAAREERARRQAATAAAAN